MTETFRDIDGIKVRMYESPDSGTPLLLIHGLGGSIDSWQENLELFGKTHKVTALDLPGFGHSDKPNRTYSISFYRDFVARFIREGPAPLSILGSSLGGQIAAEVAIKYPQLVSKLILISPAGLPPFSFKGTSVLRKYVRITKATSVAGVKKVLESMGDRQVSEDYAKSVYERISMPGARKAFLSALEQSAKAPRLAGRLRRIRCPTMVLWGQNDHMIPPKYASPFVGLANCRLVLLEHCGHRPHAEAAEAFRTLVLSFLAG